MTFFRKTTTSWYKKDLNKYRQLTQNLPEAQELIVSSPQLHDKTGTTEFDAHYTYQGPWVMRKLLVTHPKSHIDVGSWTAYLGFFSSLQPTEFVDIRPAKLRIPGLTMKEGSVLNLPYKDRSLNSISCLHVVEHVGLGRYGDPLDPLGSIKALKELSRVVAPNGNLYLSLPIGIEKTYFNAHRVLSAQKVINTLSDLKLVSLSGIMDNGSYLEAVSTAKISKQQYACGLFHFQRKA